MLPSVSWQKYNLNKPFSWLNTRYFQILLLFISEQLYLTCFGTCIFTWLSSLGELCCILLKILLKLYLKASMPSLPSMPGLFTAAAAMVKNACFQTYTLDAVSLFCFVKVMKVKGCFDVVLFFNLPFTIYYLYVSISTLNCWLFSFARFLVIIVFLVL